MVPEFITEQKTREVDAARVALQPFVAKVGYIESKIEQKEIAIEEARSHSEIQQLRKQVEQLQAEKAKAELELNAIEVRHLEVHEHRPLFMRSLEMAKQRLLIISPWINDHVLNNLRLQKIRALVDSGVEVYIGYGIGEDPNHKRTGKNKGEQAIKYLSELATKKPNLHFKDLGDTHAKILLVDDKYAVAGSFNWLSFEGDPRQGFREEMSLQLNLKPQIEDLFQYYKNTRF
jgi:phosphatidylserine/phosphatidylglycerophosphate/cardiolipin synthase-like enzyme